MGEKEGGDEKIICRGGVMFEPIEERFRQMAPIGDFCSLRLVHDTPHAETCFHQALDIARRQQAKSLELRASTSLARLWQSQDKHQAAHDQLAPVYGWFTEGFDTADLQEAKALLVELG